MTARIEFQRELTLLHQSIIRMGATVEAAIQDAIAALVDLDVDLAKRVIANDDVIDHMEQDIDRHCVDIIARQQPVASDLRDVTSTLKLITDLERIADHASDISERVLELCSHQNRLAVPHEIVTIANMALQMLKTSLDAYVSRNEEQAASVIQMDDRVDELFLRIKRYLSHLMSVDSQNVDQLVEMLLISKYVERIADHAQNVAEWVLYFVQGRLRHERDIKPRREGDESNV